MKQVLFISMTALIFCACTSSRQEAKIRGDIEGLTIYNADSARNDFAKGNRRLLTYGLTASVLSQETEDSLCRFFHFTYFPAAGCEVTDDFRKGVSEYNNEMARLLEQVNGKGWHAKYRAIVDSLWAINAEEGRKEDSLWRAEYTEQEKADSLQKLELIEQYKDKLKKEHGQKGTGR